jgi:hypothetical protein
MSKSAKSRRREESPQAKAARTRRLRRGEDAPAPQLRRGPGKRPEKTGVTAKEQLAEAFARMGGVAGMVRWAKKNPTEFYRLWARLVPKEENVNVSQLGVEDMLAELDAQAGGDAETLAVVEAAGAALGLPAPSADMVTELG